jgi:hypothetical protein
MKRNEELEELTRIENRDATSLENVVSKSANTASNMASVISATLGCSILPALS